MLLTMLALSLTAVSSSVYAGGICNPCKQKQGPSLPHGPIRLSALSNTLGSSLAEMQGNYGKKKNPTGPTIPWYPPSPAGVLAPSPAAGPSLAIIRNRIPWFIPVIPFFGVA